MLRSSLLLVGIALTVHIALPVTVSAAPAAQSPQEIAFDRKCDSPALPLDGAPIAALSVDRVPAFTPPDNDAPPGGLKTQLLVNEEGAVVRARIANPAGKAPWDEAILRWLGERRFKPRLLDSHPVCALGTYALTIEADANTNSAAMPAAAEPAASAQAQTETTPDVWVPPYVPSNALTKRFEPVCASDPRAFHETPDGASKRPVTVRNSAVNRTPAVPAAFRRAHPELRATQPSLTTLMALLVNEEGRIAEARVRKSSGFEDIDRYALEIAGNWQFNPGSLDGKPTCSWWILGATMKWSSQ